MKTLFALALLASFSAPAFAESTGAHNSRLAVQNELVAKFGFNDAELAAEQTGPGASIDLRTNYPENTAWAVYGNAGGRKVRARTVCKRVLFIYNKFDRAYRNECRVVGMQVR